MTKKEAVKILNDYRHKYKHVKRWQVDYLGSIVGIRDGHPETVCHDYLSEFEAIAMAEKYIKEEWR